MDELPRLTLEEAQARRDGASFRDPSGFVFRHGGAAYRAIMPGHGAGYDVLMRSGGYEALVRKQLLIPHMELPSCPEWAFKIIRPVQIPFISYPFEWSFTQFKRAALVTLDLMIEAMRYGLGLKDASAHNVQFLDGAPIHIDTLSFEPYEPGTPWVAYHQFCCNFLAPLALMSRRDARLLDLLRANPGGIPLDLASALLPLRTVFAAGLGLHIHAQARSKRWLARHPGLLGSRGARVSDLNQFILHLRRTVAALPPPRFRAEPYRQADSYGDDAGSAKRQYVAETLRKLRPALVYDLGANTGEFSRLAAETASLVVAVDGDPAAVDENYRRCTAANLHNVAPMLMDLTNPSPAFGWDLGERQSFMARGEADVVLALALLHHLVIAGGVPLWAIARHLASLGRSVLAEFVPRSDPQVARMLSSRKDTFEDYNEQNFEAKFSRFFRIADKKHLPGSLRVLYLLERNPRDVGRRAHSDGAPKPDLITQVTYEASGASPDQ